MPPRSPTRLLASAAMLLASACMSGGEPLAGLAPRNPSDQGPLIVWDLFAEPLPDVPFPIDVGTRPDPDSPTGRRVNVTMRGKTAHERHLRQLVNTLNGFGTYAPITVHFDARIDVGNVHARHADFDFANDAIYVISLNRDSPHFGKPVLLDLGKGRFPVGLERPHNYFLNDPRVTGSNLAFESVDEDRNGDGVLQLEEDTDSDGVLDYANTWANLAPGMGGNDPYRDLVTFYEGETNTLIIRPVLPLEEESTYAVLITRRLVGQESGSPVRSPFAAVNHTQQTPALRPLIEDGILAQLGLDADDLAFAWSFTTQSTTKDLEAIRAGLYGEGSLAQLGRDFPPRIAYVEPVEDPARTDNVHILSTERLLTAILDPEVRDLMRLSEARSEWMETTYTAWVDYFVTFHVESPAFLENEDKAIHMNRLTGDIEYGRETVYVICAIPRSHDSAPPFPVAFYGHGYTSARFEFLGFAGSLARFGIATCGLDSYGHGLPNDQFVRSIMEVKLATYGLERLGAVLLKGRARDLNNDGFYDSGGDFWTSNTFHTRDVVRQTMVDYMQVIRVMRGFGRERMPLDVDGDGRDDVAGDFDGDGAVDLGGEAPYFIFGSSLGGILAGVIGSAEPAVVAAAPVSGGGGLVDIAVRSTQGGVVQAVHMPLMGPIIAARPGVVEGRLDLVQNVVDTNREYREQTTAGNLKGLRFAQIPDPGRGENDAIEVGDRIVGENLDNGQVDEVHILPGNPDGSFRLQLPSDYGDRLRLSFYRRGAATPYRVVETFERESLFQGAEYRQGDTLRLLQEGFGYARQTPSYRRLMGFAQMITDPADPANFAKHFGAPYAQRPEGAVPTSVMYVNTTGDMPVPINTGIAMARAAGVYSLLEVDPRYGKTVDELLLEHHVIEGLEHLRRFENHPCHHDARAVLFDIDDASNGVDPDQGPRLAEVVRPPVCESNPLADACLTTCTPQPPLRATTRAPSGVTLAMRIPYPESTGSHGINIPQPARPFDYYHYQINQIGRFFQTLGAEVVDDPCLATGSCSFMTPMPSE